MFWFTNKKFIGVLAFEVSFIKWMEKSEVIQKTLQWKYRLISYHFTSDWYHFYLLLICIDFTAKYKIKPVYYRLHLNFIKTSLKTIFLQNNHIFAFLT